MAIEKTVIVDDKPVLFRASAAVPRLYRLRFRRDILSDMKKLQAAYNRSLTAGEDEAESEELDYVSLQLFEDIAYIMAYHANPEIPNKPDDWLEGFDTFSIYEVLPEILELWHLNEETQVDAKKKKRRFLSGR